MIESVHAAAASVESKPGETGDNLKKIAASAAHAANEGAALILFPELSITGFIPNHPVGDHSAWLRQALVAARKAAQPVPGPAIHTLIEIAAGSGIHIAAGMLEDAGNVLYNTHVLVGPGGLLGAWRKMHIPMFEMPFYNGGPAPPVVATPFGRVGINICFDALLPESTRLLAVQNAEIVLFPFAADPAPGTPQAWFDWASGAVRARCQENGVFGVACNYFGYVECADAEQSFPGGALACGPRGEVVAQNLREDDQDTMLMVELKAEDLTAARAEPEYLFRFRRPELYRSLIE
ncbi:MAG: carbon-nitrogen hydrolase family protein [Bryobacterales bacterium]|nr:carbon-nitrogen hydrolase family protein [Bryobacterales bacterium]